MGSFARHDRDATMFQTIELQLGVNGPSALGRQSTDYVHRWIPAPEVDWSRQERDRLDASAIITRSHVQGPFVMHYGAALGTIVSLAHAGAEFRFGPSQAALSPLLRMAATPPLPLPGGNGNWGGFIGAGARAVLRNEMIGRNYDPGAADIERKKTVARVAAGLTWSGSWASASFALARDTREFAGQRAPHAFGSLAVSIDF
jgi:hypothetical protein